MNRRSFMTSLTVGLPCTAALAEAGQALADGLSTLGRELQSARDESSVWAAVRKEFLLNPGLVQLNTGSLGSTPRRVLDAVAAWMYELEGDPVSNVYGLLGHRMEEVRKKAADFLAANLEEVVLTENTTSGMNAVAGALIEILRPGDEVLTTNHEHPGGAVCWDFLVQHHGVKVVPIPMPAPVKDKGEILDLVVRHITPRTRVCSFSHVETITGLRMPLPEIAAITRPKEIFLVCDGAQAPGMLKVDVKALGVDTYASSSHKWMLAPKGSGLLYIRKGVQDQIRPLALSTGYQAYTSASGTRNVAQILGHGLSMDFHNAIGRDRVEARCRALCDHLRRRLLENSALKLLTPTQAELSSGIVTFSLLRGSHEKVYQQLHAEHEILVKVVPKPEYNALRFSTHVFNREEELDRTADALASLVRA
jgi:selenocysteine lyase/cysteine desulfurase